MDRTLSRPYRPTSDHLRFYRPSSVLDSAQVPLAGWYCWVMCPFSANQRKFYIFAQVAAIHPFWFLQALWCSHRRDVAKVDQNTIKPAFGWPSWPFWGPASPFGFCRQCGILLEEMLRSKNLYIESLLTLIRRGGGQMAHRVLKAFFLGNQRSDWPQTRL